MMMQSKRLIKVNGIWIAIAATFVLSFSGCDRSQNAVNDGAQDKKVTLKWVMMGVGRQKDSEEVWEEFNKKLTEKLPNTNIEFDIIPPSEYNEKWKLMVASSEKVDIAWAGYLTSYLEDIKKGAYLSLNNLLDTNAPELKKVFPDWVWQKVSVDGKIYAVPSYQLMTGMRYSIHTPKSLADKYIDRTEMQNIFYNDKTMTEDSYNAIEDYLKLLKQNNEIALGVDAETFSWVSKKGFEVITPLAVIKKDEKDLKVYNRFELPETKLLYRTMAKWYQAGYIRHDIMTLDNPRVDAYKKDGNILMVHDYFKNTEDNMKATYKREFAAIPLVDHYTIDLTVPTTNNAIVRTCQDPERAIKFLELINTERGKDLYNLLVWGIEGEHYKKISDNRIETLDYVDQATSNSKYGLNKWVVGNTFNAYLNQTVTDDWNDYIQNDVNGKAEISPLMGFKVDIDPIQSEVAQVDAILGQYEKVLRYGVLPNYEEYYNQMLEKLKVAGGDKIITEIQRQVDEWAVKNGKK